MADYIVSLKADVSKVKKDIESVGASINGVVSAAKVFAAFWVSSKFVKAGIEFEDQLNEVTVAFQQAGIYSQSATKNMADFAAEIQRTTKFSDNAVLTTSSLINSLARLDSQGLKGATKAALDLSTSLRIDLNAAATLIGKAAEGNISAFTRYGIVIEKGKTKAETFANTLQALSRFSGASEAATNTFGGALAQLENNFDDVIKNIGLAIIKNDDLVKVVKIVSESLAEMAEFIADNADVIKAFISGGLSILVSLFKNLPQIIAAATTAFALFNASAIIGAVRPIIEYVAWVGRAVLAQGIWNTALATFRGILASLGIGLVIAAVSALVAWVVSLYREFGSLNRVISGAALYFSKFVATITGNEKAAASYEKQLQKLRDTAEQAKESGKAAFDEQKAFRDMAREARQEQSEQEQAAAAQRQRDIQEMLQREREASEKAIDQMRGQLKNAGLSAFDALVSDTNKSIEEVSKALQLGTINQKEAVALREKIDADFYVKSTKIAEDETKKQLEETKKLVDERRKLFDTIGGYVGDVAKGASGAADLISKGVGAVADTLLPGIGGFVTQIVSFLAQGPEKVREIIQSFAAAIPEVITNIILAIPAVIQAFNDSIPLIIENVIANLPMLIEALIASLPQIILSSITLMPRVVLAFSIALIKAIPGIIQAFIGQIPNVIVEFTATLVSAAWDFVKAIWDAIASFVPGGGLLTGQDSGGGIIGDAIGAVGDFFGFAEGGMVPAGYPNDSFPAKLTSGEAVLPTDTVSKLESFLANGGGAGQNVTINLVVGEEQLAKVMLNLNRQGFRTS